MRIAVFADVHGNLAALDAVLAAAGPVDGFWFLGDLVAHGPRPVECVRRVAELPGLVAVRGNTDRYVLTEPPDPVMAESFAWTRTLLGAAGLLGWLGDLQLEQRVALMRDEALLVHASPGRDDGPGLDPQASEEDLAAAGFTADTADLIAVGHTHHPASTAIAGAVVVNPGSVSLPRTSDAAARYGVITTYDVGWSFLLHDVPYDRDAVLADLDSVGHPSAAWLQEKLTTPWG